MDDDAISADTTGKPLPPLALRSAGLAGAERIAPPKNNGTSGKLPAIVLGWLPTVSQSPQLSALVLTLLALSMGLLVIASIEPGHLSRYHSVRVFSRHRAGIAWFGGAVFVTAILLFSLQLRQLTRVGRITARHDNAARSGLPMRLFRIAA